jgi:flagellar biosynthesis GTPase FlhF
MGGLDQIVAVALWAAPHTRTDENSVARQVGEVLGTVFGVAVLLLIPSTIALVIFLFVRRHGMKGRRQQAEWAARDSAFRAQEETRRRAEHAEAQRRAGAEQQRLATEAQRRTAEQQRISAEADARARLAHEEAQRRAAQSAEERRRAEFEESGRRSAERAEANRVAQEEEASRLAAEQAERERAQWESLVARFGPDDAARIHRREIWVGMTVDMLGESRGKPFDVDEKVLKTKTKHVYKYKPTGANRYALRVTLDDGEVVGWEDKS